MLEKSHCLVSWLKGCQIYIYIYIYIYICIFIKKKYLLFLNTKVTTVNVFLSDWFDRLTATSCGSGQQCLNIVWHKYNMSCSRAHCYCCACGGADVVTTQERLHAVII